MSNQSVVEGEVIEAGETYDPDLNAAFYAFVDSIDTEANGGGQIAVFEVPVDGKGMARARATRTKLFTVPIGTCTYEEICERVLDDFMKAGETMIIQLMGTRDGRKGIQFNKQIRLRKSNNADKSLAAPQSDVMALVRAMQESAARDRAEMRLMMQELLTARTPAVDPMAFGMQMASKLTELASALNRPPAVPQSALVPGVAQGSMPEQMMQLMAMMKMLRSFARETSDAPASGSDWAATLKEIAGMAAPLLGAYKAKSEAEVLREKRLLAAPVTAPAPAPAPDPVPSADSSPMGSPAADSTAVEIPSSNASNTEDDEMKLLMELKAVMPMLIEFAEKNSDVRQVASMALSTMPDDHHMNDALYALVSDDKCVEKLAVLDERVTRHREWFEQFRLAIVAEFEPDAGPSS